MKIYIIGASGSGKSTLAKELSLRTGIENTDLDELFWVNDTQAYGKKREESERDTLFHNLLQKESWIIEGVYLSWPEKALFQSDVILFLDIPLSVLNIRIIKRFLLRKLGIYTNKKKETWKDLVALLKWNKKQTKWIRERFQNGVRDFPKLIRLSHKKEIQKYLITLF